MNHGFLYHLFSFIIEKLKKINLVEVFKDVARSRAHKEDDTRKAAYARTGTDIYIIFKWLFILILWTFSFNSTFLTIAVWYLIVTNIFTYFYYHIWDKDAMDTGKLTIDRARRRFLNLIQAVGFSTLCFAYLYHQAYRGEFEWHNKIIWSRSFLFSFSNSLAGNYTDVSPNSDQGNLIANIQLLFSFFFLTIILAKSLPETSLTETAVRVPEKNTATTSLPSSTDKTVKPVSNDQPAK
jgi:hypothetical protein